MKKMFSLVLALVMALSLTTVAWGATSVSDLAGLQDAIDAGETAITLTAPITISADTTIEADAPVVITSTITGAVDVFTVTAGTLTLGNNVTITSANGALLLAYGGNIVVGAGAVVSATGSAYPAVLAYNGTVTVNGGTITSVDNALVATSQGAVVINAGTVETTSTNPATSASYCFNGGTITMNDGTVNGPLGAAASGTVVINNGTVNGNVASYGDANASAEINGGEVTGTVYTQNDADATITGGTFATDVSEYVDADSGFTNNGDGTYTVAVKSANTSLYDLYEGDETLYLEDVYRTKFAAKKLTKTQVGQVAGWDIEGTLYVEITKAEATKADFYLTKANKDDVVVYLREAENHGMYTLTGKAYDKYNEGDDNCGEWNYDPDLVAMYKDDVDGDIYTDLGPTAYMLVGKTVVGVALADEVNMVDHQMEGVYDAKDKLVGVKCVVCGATGKFYESAGKAPLGADVKPFGTVGYYVLNKVAVKPADTETKVESAETFDAGIAMYVGMSVMAAAGSAVVIGKKKD